MTMKTTAILLLAVALMPLGMIVRADDATNAVKTDAAHPETAMHEHEANSAAADTTEYKQQRDEAKARMKKARADYEKSLKAEGADSAVTKDAKKRYLDARDDYRKFAKKTDKAAQDLTEDQEKVAHDKATQ